PRLHPGPGPRAAAIRDAGRHRLYRGQSRCHKPDRSDVDGEGQERRCGQLEHPVVDQRHPRQRQLSNVDLVSPADRAAVGEQLGREPRAIRAVAHRCPCGNPDVVETTPRLPDGTPFPTLYYLTCPRAVAEGGRLESAGVMRDMAQRLRDDPVLAQAYRAAHEDYLRRRTSAGPAGGDVPEIEGVSA